MTSRFPRSFLLILALASSHALAQDGGAPPEAGAGPTATASADLSLPELKPSEWFDGKFGGTFGAKTVTAFPKTNRVAIAGFRVIFVTHNEARAISRASYLPGGVERGSAKAKMVVDLAGVDEATMQAITDRAYADFVAQLKLAGREVLPVDQMQSFFETVKRSPQPYKGTLGLAEGRGFAPTGQPLWFQVGDAWGDAGLGQSNMRSFNELSARLNAPITIAPLIVVDFAQMQSSGNRSSLMQRTASVGATLAMSVPTFSTRVVRAEEVRYGGLVSKGDDGALALKAALDTDIEFAEMVEVNTEEDSGNGIGKLFGVLGIASTKGVKQARTSNDAYRLAAESVLNRATGTFAKLFQENPAAGG